MLSFAGIKTWAKITKEIKENLFYSFKYKYKLFPISNYASDTQKIKIKIIINYNTYDFFSGCFIIVLLSIYWQGPTLREGWGTCLDKFITNSRTLSLYHHVIQQAKLQIESQGLKHKIVLNCIHNLESLKICTWHNMVMWKPHRLVHQNQSVPLGG